jgi:hypothetical protein
MGPPEERPPEQRYAYASLTRPRAPAALRCHASASFSASLTNASNGLPGVFLTPSGKLGTYGDVAARFKGTGDVRWSSNGRVQLQSRKSLAPRREDILPRIVGVRAGHMRPLVVAQPH